MDLVKPIFLLTRFSAIGDVVITTPVVRALRKKYPDAEIHYITKGAFAPVIQHHPDLTRTWTVKNHPSECLDELKSYGFTHLVDLHKNRRSVWLYKRLGIPVYKFPKVNIQKWLVVQTKIRSLLPAKHLVHRYFEGYAALGITYDEAGMDLPFPPRQPDLPASLPAESFVVLMTGASYATKALPVELSQSIIAQSPLPVVLVGGPREKEACEKLAENSAGKAISFAGQLDLLTSAAVIQKSQAVIAGDTGMMHFAAALKKPLISIWGSTIPEIGMYPLFPTHLQHLSILLDAHISCQPCTKLGFESCPKIHYACMRSIRPEQVIEALNKLLSLPV